MKQSSSIESEQHQTRYSYDPAGRTSPVRQAFADNRESTAIQRQLMVAMANSPQAIMQRLISQRIHSSPRVLVQRKMLSGISGESVLPTQPGKGVTQMVNVGFIPVNPGNYRGTTTITGISTTMAGDKAFNNSQRPQIYADNVNNGGANAPIIGPGQHPTEDTNGGALIDRSVVTPIEPEIDHIVPRQDGGANDFSNARVLSKANNMNGGVIRPGRVNQILRLYQNITLSANIPQNNQPNFVYGPTQINAGAALSNLQGSLLALHAGVNGINGVAALSGGNVNSISAAGRNTNNYVTVV